MLMYQIRMGGRVVEGTGLENRQARKRLEGSNPSPSANYASILLTSLNNFTDRRFYPSYYHFILALKTQAWAYFAPPRGVEAPQGDLPPQPG